MKLEREREKPNRGKKRSMDRGRKEEGAKGREEGKPARTQVEPCTQPLRNKASLTRMHIPAKVLAQQIQYQAEDD